MIATSLIPKLYTKLPTCLHVDSYQIWDGVQAVCGPCYFRMGVLDELPTRITMREESGAFGSPQFDPRFISHVMLSAGLIAPNPGESMKEFRQRRRRTSYPSPHLFPFTSAVWELMGVQPPLAKVLVQFCQGYGEYEIADHMELSLYNVHERLRKAVHVAKKNLKVTHAPIG